MLISEQKLANLGGVYYRGLKNVDLSKKRYDETYLTTRFIYALTYATRNGVVEQYCLKSTASIFNMKCKTDEDNLRKFCRLKPEYSRFLKYIDLLKDNDWKAVLKTDREELAKIIRKLDYDGYFNFEIERKVYGKVKDYPICPFSSLSVESPAMAVFDIESSMKKTANLSGIALLQNPAFRKAREQEISYIMSSGYNYEFDDIRSRIVTLSDAELKDLLLRAGRKENTEAQTKRKQNILKEWNERLNRA